jgi:long-subunit fatty acid transport protein
MFLFSGESMTLPRVLRTLVFASIAIFAAAPATYAQAFSGLHSTTPGARANGMGGTFIAIADDASAAISNPAGLGNLTRPQVYAEITSGKAGFEFTDVDAGESRLTSLSFASASAPVNDKVTVGATYYEFLNFKVTDTSLGTNDELTFTGRSYGVSAAYNATSQVKVGATVTLDNIKSKETGFADTDDKGVGFEVGGLWQANEKVSVGVTGAHGSEDAGNINRVGAGVAYRPAPQLLTSVDIVRLQSGFDITETHLGGEYAIAQASGTLLLRAGGFFSSNDPDHEDRSGTFGVGYAAKSKFQVDLAYATKHKRVVASAGVRF